MLHSLIRAALVGATLALGLSSASVGAHVTVAPDEAPTSATLRYALRVAGEKAIPTTRIEVQFPTTLTVTEVEAEPGWGVTTQTASGGRVVGAVWDGGRIALGQFVEFAVLARNPDTPSDLTWRAIQTYADGSEVQWIGPPDASFPAAVTRVRPAVVIGLSELLAGAAVTVSLVALSLVWLTWRRVSPRVAYRGNSE